MKRLDRIRDASRREGGVRVVTCPLCGKEGERDNRSGYVYCSNEDCEVANIASWIAVYGNRVNRGYKI